MEHWLQEGNRQEATEIKQLKDDEVEQEHSREGSRRPSLFLISAVLLVSFSLTVLISSSDGTLLRLQGEHAVKAKLLQAPEL